MPPALILSQDQTLMFKVVDLQPSAPRPLARTTTRRPSADLLNAKALMALAALFSLSSCPRLHPGPHDPGRPRADTRRVVCPPPPFDSPPRGGSLRASARLVCACTHYLVFKEPAVAAALSGGSSPLRLSSREPSKVTTATVARQDLFIGPAFFRPRPPQPSVAWGTLQAY
jgi:hypothetical protein